jgi:hypothetical protein
VPPWINKVLCPRPSFEQFLHQMNDGARTHRFVISCVNSDERLATKTFEDYMFEGPLAALTFIEQAVGELEVNAIGYCLGGTVLLRRWPIDFHRIKDPFVFGDAQGRRGADRSRGQPGGVTVAGEEDAQRKIVAKAKLGVWFCEALKRLEGQLRRPVEARGGALALYRATRLSGKPLQSGFVSFSNCAIIAAQFLRTSSRRRAMSAITFPCKCVINSCVAANAFRVSSRCSMKASRNHLASLMPSRLIAASVLATLVTAASRSRIVPTCLRCHWFPLYPFVFGILAAVAKMTSAISFPTLSLATMNPSRTRSRWA